MQDEVNFSDYNRRIEAMQELNKEVSIATLIDDMQTLAGMLAHETTLVEARKYEDMRAMYSDKMTLVKSLERRKKVIAHDSSVLMNVTPNSLKELKEAQKELGDALAEHNELLTKSRTRNRVVMKAIADVVSKDAQDANSTFYNQKATMSPQDAGRKVETPFVAVNESA